MTAVPYLVPRTEHVTLDQAGGGSVSFQIDNTNQRWVIDLATVSTDQTASAPVPVCLCYLDGTFAGGTRQADMDTGQGRIVLYPDSVLEFRWSGGVPGSVATATIAGTFDRAGVPLE